MGNRPRGLGNVARDQMQQVDDKLAHVIRLLKPQADGERMLEKEVELIGLRASLELAEVRRIVTEILALRE